MTQKNCGSGTGDMSQARGLLDPTQTLGVMPALLQRVAVLRLGSVVLPGREGCALSLGRVAGDPGLWGGASGAQTAPVRPRDSSSLRGNSAMDCVFPASVLFFERIPNVRR